MSENDVFVASYPRSGSTWLRMMLAHLLLGDKPEFDSLPSVVPGVGQHSRAEANLPNGGRLIMTHERRQSPYAFKCRRGIYLVRDGRDVAVSYYHWLQRREGYEGEFSELVRAFLRGRINGYGTWSAHVESWVGEDTAASADTLLIRYEDLLDDPESRLSAAAEFAGMNPNRHQLREAVTGQRLASMREKERHSTRLQEVAARPDVPFIRKGKAGEWREYLDERDLVLFEAQAGSTLRRLGYIAEE